MCSEARAARGEAPGARDARRLAAASTKPSLKLEGCWCRRLQLTQCLETASTMPCKRLAANKLQASRQGSTACR